jgi:hypothetical protein
MVCVFIYFCYVFHVLVKVIPRGKYAKQECEKNEWQVLALKLKLVSFKSIHERHDDEWMSI